MTFLKLVLIAVLLFGLGVIIAVGNWFSGGSNLTGRLLATVWVIAVIGLPFVAILSGGSRKDGANVSCPKCGMSNDSVRQTCMWCDLPLVNAPKADVVE